MAITLPPDYRPTPDEPFMNEQQREYFRLKLVTWRDEILRGSEGTRQGLGDGASNEPDDVDRAALDIDQALELRTRDRERKLLVKIEQALLRLKAGRYGFCEESGVPIGLARLEARPIATLSIQAQERHEQRERNFGPVIEQE